MESETPASQAPEGGAPAARRQLRKPPPHTGERPQAPGPGQKPAAPGPGQKPPAPPAGEKPPAPARADAPLDKEATLKRLEELGWPTNEVKAMSAECVDLIVTTSQKRGEHALPMWKDGNVVGITIGDRASLDAEAARREAEAAKGTPPVTSPAGSTPTGEAPAAPAEQAPPAVAQAPAQEAPPAQPTTPPAAPPVVDDEDGDVDLSKLGTSTLAFTAAEDVELKHLTHKILVYGDSGAGKTHFASGAPNVAVMLVESQGFATIRRANPGAIVPGNADPTGERRLRSMAEVREFMRLAATGALKKAGIKTIVVDSFTEVQQMMIDEIQADKRAAAKAAAEQKKQAKPGPAAAKAPAPTGGKAPEMTKQDWGTLSVKCRNFLRALRDLPYNVVILCLAEPSLVDQPDGSTRRMVLPKVSGSTAAALPSYVNIAGYIYKVGEGDDMRRAILLDGDDRYYTKSLAPLTGVVEADLSLWLRVLAGEEESARAEGVKAPGAGRRKIARGGTTTDKKTDDADADDDPEASGGDY